MAKSVEQINPIKAQIDRTIRRPLPEIRDDQTLALSGRDVKLLNDHCQALAEKAIKLGNLMLRSEKISKMKSISSR